MTNKKTNDWRTADVRNKKYGGVMRHFLTAKVENVDVGSYVITQTEPSFREGDYEPGADSYMDDGSFSLVFLHGIMATPIYRFTDVAIEEFDAVLDFLKTHAVSQHLRGIEKAIRLKQCQTICGA